MPNYTYSARDARGALKRGQLEAADRATALATLKARGLAPVSLESGAVMPGRRLPTWWRAALLALALLGPLAVALLWPGKKSRPQRSGTPSPATAREEPADAPRTLQAQEAPKPPALSEPARSEPFMPPLVEPAARREAPEVAGAAPENSPTLPATERPPPPKPLFCHESEQILALYTRPGSPVPPVPFSRNIEADALAALESDIIVTDEDSPEDEAKKEMVAWMKQELRTHLADGGTFPEFVEMLQKRQDQESELLREARSLFINVARTGDLKATEQARAELNKVLQEHNIPPMPMPGNLRRRLK